MIGRLLSLVLTAGTALLWSKTRAPSVARLGVLLLGLLLVFFGNWRVYELDVTVQMEIPGTADAELYYSFNGIAYYPEQSQLMKRHYSADGTSFSTRILTNRPIKGLRFDPLNEKGDFKWSSIAFRGAGGETKFAGEALTNVMASSVSLQPMGTTDGILSLRATSVDSQIVMGLPAALTRLPKPVFWSYVLTLLGLSAAGALALNAILAAARPCHPISLKSKALLDRIAQRFSEDGTIRFSRASVFVLISILCMSVIWVALKLHQSSLGVWSTMYTREYTHHWVDIGTPKIIRTDEWRTVTPWILNQVQTGMPADNANIGALGSAILTGTPVNSPLMLAQPKFWGFFFLDIERGFAWMWAFKLFGMIGAYFLLLLMLTKGETLISLGGALGLYGSSYVQWWYSSVPPEIVFGYSLSIIGTVYLLQARKMGGLLFGAAMLSLAIPNLLLHLYPPSLLPLIYLSAFILLGLLANRPAFALVVQRWPLRAGLGLCVVALWMVFAFVWYTSVKDTIELMMNTHYPGRRYALGGESSLTRLFFGFFESWQTTEDVRPFNPSNNSEMSNFWMLFPLAFVLVSFRQWLQKPLRTLALLLVFCVLTVLWATGPMPDVVRVLMASAGWFMVPGDRVIFSLGLASSLATVVLMAGTARGDISVVRWPTSVLVALGVAVVVVYGMWLQLSDPVFFHWGRILLAAALVAGFVVALHRGHRKLFFLCSVAVAAPMLYVNPIQSGIDAYLNKDLFVHARAVGGKATDRWAVFGELPLTQGFKMAGLNVLNGTHYVPRMDVIRALDPGLTSSDVWNRYGHVQLKEALPGKPPVFELLFLDHYAIGVDVCGPHIRAAGVTHAAFDKMPSQASLSCLEPVFPQENLRVYYYRLK